MVGDTACLLLALTHLPAFGYLLIPGSGGLGEDCVLAPEVESELVTSNTLRL